MKVQCDVCAADAASVFCCADEAALCDACDRRVHRANKLAGKHRRFSLLHAEPEQKQHICDICQERRGLFFCKEERSILCRECDVRVHTATELTRGHCRFLLTGVRLSSEPVDSPTVPEEEEAVVEEKNSSSPRNANSGCGVGAGEDAASASEGSSISEYLTKTLPGWHVEDFLVDDAGADIAGCSDGPDQGEGGQTQVGGLLQEACPALWAAEEQSLGDVAVTTEKRARRERWVPQMQMHADWTGCKRPRAQGRA